MDREVWRAVVHGDNGWWQLVRVVERADGLWEVETNTRASVVPTTLRLDRDDVRSLFHALGGALRIGVGEEPPRAVRHE